MSRFESLRGKFGRKPKAPKPTTVETSAPRRALRVVLFAVLGVLFALPAVFVNTVIGYMPVFGYVLVVGLSYAYAKVLSTRLELDQGGMKRECTRGEEVDFAFTVRNLSILPVVRVNALFFMSDLFGGEGAAEVHRITLAPNGEKTFNVGIGFNHIGTFEVGIKEYTVSDPLGLFSFVQHVERLAQVEVMPRLFDVEKLPVVMEAATEAKKSFTSVINDGMDYSGVREYRWGDPIKAIHWKLSARMPLGDYYTRLYETNANPGLSIVADFDAPEYDVNTLMDVYDTVVECAFSLEHFADVRGFDAELLFQDKAKRKRLYATPFVGHHAEILERMPHIFAPGSGKEALGLVQEALGSTFAQVNLIVCTSVISDALLETLIAARNGKRTPLLVAVVPEGVDDEVRKGLIKRLERLSAAGVGYAVVSDARDLEVV